MTRFTRAFADMCRDFARAQGPRVALLRAAGSLRVLAYPRLMRRMAAEGYLARVSRKRGADGQPWDPFHFASHPDYLVRGYSIEQRFRAALDHYRCEAALFDEAFVDRLYAPQGITLWSAEAEGHAFVLRMGLSGLETLEGDLYLRLFADGRPIGSMNFVWADSATFGGDGSPTIFISRCQTHTWPEIQVFRQCFKQNSPPYFGLAALAGIGQACGMRELYAVHARAQTHYDPKYAASFGNSYDEFWDKFKARRVRPEAFRLPLPLALRDLSELKSKHRSRAEARRRAWGAVGEAAAAVIRPHVRAPVRNAAGADPDAAPPADAAPSRSVQGGCAAALLVQGMQALPLPLLA